MLRKIGLFLFLVSFIMPVFAGTLVRNFTFDNVVVEHNSGYDQLTLDGMITYGEPGKPSLPLFAHTLLVPPGEELVKIEIESQNWVKIPGTILPEPGSEVMPLSKWHPTELTPDPSIYSSNKSYPGSVITGVQTGFLRGHSMADFLINPVRWNPATGKAEQLTSIRLRLETVPTPKAEQALRMLRNDRSTVSMMRQVTDDLEVIGEYPAVNELDEVSLDFLIICDIDHAEAWEEYADYKRSCGMQTEVITTQEIYDTYLGDDNQDRIRNAIINYYYTDWIDYVLLGGDVSMVPYRGLYATVGQQEVDYNIPADLYYACLDGTWNIDNDDRWGEPNEADLYHEISIGRASVLNVDMIETWIEKQIRHQAEPVVGEALNALMVGEDLGWDNMGGDYMDEVWHGSNNYGYRTVGFNGDWIVQSLYDRDGVWGLQQLFDDLNGGISFINHLGHANVTYALKASNGNINDNSLTNNGINHTYYLAYTQGCYCGAFEQASITEKWTTIENGAYAFVSNSRYGWGSGNNTDGASQRYHRQFVDAIFAEDIHRVGDINRDSKHDNIQYIDLPCMRWCYYEINLFGDPTVDFTSGPIEEYDVTCPDVCQIGDDNLVVTVSGGEGACVSLSQNNELLAVDETNADGIAMLDVTIEQPGPLTISVTGHNHLPFETEILAVAAEGGYPNVQGMHVSDEVTGNGNGQADYGETVDISVEIVNRGLNPIEQLTLNPSSSSPWITVEQIELTAQDIAPDEGATLTFPVQITGSAPDRSSAEIELSLVADTLARQSYINLELHAPRLSMRLVDVNDEEFGDGGHRLYPGETGSLAFTVTNTGTSDLEGVTLSPIANDNHLENLNVEPVPITVPVGESVTFEDFLSLTISPDAGSPSLAWLLCKLEREDGFEFSTFAKIEIGGFFDNLENEVDGYEHYAGAGWGDQWYLSDERNYTFDGSHAWKVGTVGGNYADHLDSYLELPPIERDGPITLKFRHWMDAEISTRWAGDCYDGGRVELSNDGEHWEALPMAGYNYCTRGNGPFGEDVMVFSGQIDWKEESHTILGDTSPVIIRFHFGSDNGTTAEGWYIDDISFDQPEYHAPPRDVTGEMEDGIVTLQWNTPNGNLDDSPELLGFVIYRNNTPISDLVRDLSFTDNLADQPSDHYIYQVSASYNSGNSQYAGGYEVDWVQTNHHLNVPLQARYFELVSTPIIPEELSADQVFGDVENLGIVYQDDGGIFLPPSINTIGDIDNREAYQVFCEEESEWNVTGTLMDPATVYRVIAGPWQWIGYPFDYPMPAEAALSEVADALEIMITDDGRMWVPQLNINILGDMQPGEGYQLIANTTRDFQYSQAAVAMADENAQPSVIQIDKDYLVPTGLPYAVILRTDMEFWKDNPSLVELYDGTWLVGGCVIMEQVENIPVVAWQGDADRNLTGFTQGDQITIVVKSADGNVLQTIQPANRSYGDGAYAEVTLGDHSGQVPREFTVKPAFPNPFNPSVTIPFTLPEAGELSITVFNVLGQLLFSNTQAYEAGAHSFLFDATEISRNSGKELVSGLYFLQIQFKGQTNTQKVMLLK